MIPASLLYDQIPVSVVNDVAGLGIATFLKVCPIIAPFVPSTALLTSDLTLGTGSLAFVATTALPTTSLDPITGAWQIVVPEPAGGWSWSYDGGDPAPPVTVYGFALQHVVGNQLMATMALDTPIVLTLFGQLLQFHQSFLIMQFVPFM